MKLFILGATGGIGRSLVDQAIAAGHTVTVFVRSPDKVQRADIRVVKGDPCDEAALAAALPGHDAVLSALGPPGVGKTTIHRDAARATIAAMKASGVTRLLVVSAAVNFEAGPLIWLFRHTFLRNISEDTLAMEALVAESDLAYTIARPPRLVDGPATARYAVADEALPAGRGVLSRGDVAHFMLDELKMSAHLRHVVGMAGT
jgi:putative NADH-flavin reductase